MLPARYSNRILIFIFLLFSSVCFAQDADSTAPVKKAKIKGFHAGVYAGSLFASSYSAYTYDGYGFDRNGIKNNFSNSLMYWQIIYLNGGGNNQPDRIAPALGVAVGDWSFDSTDMPTRMRYNVAIQVGFNSRYCFDKKNAIVLNVNGSKLTATGDFTITTYNNVNSNPNAPQNSTLIRTFAVIGTEQRLMFQAGYQRIIGDNDNLNFFMEIGPDLVLAKYDKNQVNINGLVLDLTSYYKAPLAGYSPYRPKNLTGEGIGLFSAFGLNLNTGSKWSAQVLYSPSIDLIKIGENPKRTLQNAFGLRGYYNF